MSGIKRLARAAKRRLTGSQTTTSPGPMYRLSPDEKPRGRMLLSLGTPVYERLLGGETLDVTHIAAWQNFNISRTFLDLGFQVDVIDWNNDRVVPEGPYDVAIDVIANMERLDAHVGSNCVKILHAMFAHWVVHNANNYARHSALLARRGIGMPPVRQLPASTSVEAAEHIICRGGPYSLESYSHGPAKIHRIPQLHPFGINEFLERDMAACRRRFVFLGGFGCVHKGLDLVLEAFAELPDCELVVCGKITNEPHFEAFYRRELDELPNVHRVGWVDTTSDEWRRISGGCAASILPSCSETSVGSMVCCMINGLIPVTTDEADIELDGIGVRIEDATVESVRRAVRAVSERDPAELADLSRAAYEAAGSRFGRDRFLNAYRETVCDILDLEPLQPWAAWDAAFRVPRIERVIA